MYVRMVFDMENDTAMSKALLRHTTQMKSSVYTGKLVNYIILQIRP